MASSGVNVLRYTALLTGLAYGLYHQSTITSSEKSQHADHAFAQEQTMIQKAKQEWALKTKPADTRIPRVIEDPNDARFDFEAYLTAKMADKTL